jgi:myo-inositol-1(or 4)-monophosphatase
MSTSLHPMLNIAIKAARAAGAIINRGSQDLDLLTVTSKGPNDFVSEVDQAAEAVIIETLLTAYPGHGILAEESGREHGAKNSEFTWIIDPLDGTTNFLHGFPVYCVSIALAHRGVVQQAVVYDPTRNDLFYASRGRGAYLNDKRLRVSKRTRLADSLIGTGFPFRRGDNFQRYLKMFEAVMTQCAGLRRPGAAALDLCYVAAGWYDGFFETGLNPWDMAAGSLIITEAGGLVGNFTGESDFLYQRELVCGTPKVYGQLVALLSPFSRAIKNDEANDGSEGQAPAAPAGDVVAAALAASLVAPADAVPAVASPPAERERKPVRVRKHNVGPDGEPLPAPAVSYKAPEPYADRPPYGDRADRAPHGDRPAPRKTFGPRPDGDRPFGDRPAPRKTIGQRPDGDRPRGPRPDDERPQRTTVRPGAPRPVKPRPKGDGGTGGQNGGGAAPF